MSVLRGLLSGSILSGTPLLYATLAEMVSERAGVVNLGLEGVMLVGAVAGFIATVHTGSAAAGVVVAALAGGIFNLVFAYLVITRRANQLATGLALMFAGVGLSALMGARYVGEPALRVAQKYPDVKFVHPGGFKRAPNFTTYWASTPEAFYLMGVAAGKTTKTNKIGYVVALPISFFLANINAFELGARSVNPNAETRVVFTGTFLDPAREATAANALLEQGVDTLGVIVDSPITVVQTAEKRGAYAIGFHSLGAQKFAPKGWISGVAFTWGNLYTRFAREVLEGTFKSENILGTLRDDFLTIAPFGPAVPADAVRLIETKKADLISGKLHPFQGPLRDNRGVERVKAGEVFPLTELRKMDWLVEGVVGQPK